MQNTARFSLAGLALVAATLASPASAAPTSGFGSAASGENLVVKVHGCHRSCEWGSVRGWHRHVGVLCRPVRCVPRAAFPHRCWVDYRGVRRCRW